jgi:hypothetical protein
MKWTTEKPTKPGFYWVRTLDGFRYPSASYIITCVDVAIDPEGNPWLPNPHMTQDEPMISANTTTHWIGPISKPEPPLIHGGKL